MFAHRYNHPPTEWRVMPSAATGQLPSDEDFESHCRLGESVLNCHQVFASAYHSLLPQFQSLRSMSYEDRVREAHLRYGEGVAFLTSWDMLESVCADSPITVLQTTLDTFTLARVAWLERCLARAGVRRMICDKWPSQSWLDPARTLVLFRDDDHAKGPVPPAAHTQRVGAPLPTREFEQFLDKAMLRFGQSEMWLWRVVLEHHEQGWMLDGDRMLQLRRQSLLRISEPTECLDLPQIPWLESSSSSPESLEDP